MNGGYDDGYKSCPCFWGNEPGSLVKLYTSSVGLFKGFRVLDAGCGEGKNAYYFGQRGSTVLAIDVSDYAIHNAKRTFGNIENVTWLCGNIRDIELPDNHYNIVIAYGLLHCLHSEVDIKNLVMRLQSATKKGGYHLVCAFNNRHQELDAHPEFRPCLMPHSFYLDLYVNWKAIHISDSDLHETHPHNQIPHTHSMTRILAQKLI